MVLVRVRDDDPDEVALALQQEADVGKHGVDARQHLLVAEGDAHVDGEPFAARAGP